MSSLYLLTTGGALEHLFSSYKSTDYFNIDINELVLNSSEYIQTILQNSTFEQKLETELTSDATSSGYSGMKLTFGFVPTVTEQLLDGEKLFRNFCLNQCEQNQFLKLDGNVTKLSIYKAICVDTDCPIRAKDNCDTAKYTFPGNYNDTIINTMKAGFTCTYKNMCLDAADNTCHTDADCSMTGDGTYSCSCKTGYSGDGASCINDNECNGVNDCSSDAICIDSDGSYSCHCQSGYVGTGLVCTNIDECVSVALNNCHTNATCTDSAGSYNCNCDAGYFGDGVTCVGGLQRSVGFLIQIQSQLSFDLDFVQDYSDVTSVASLALWQRTRPPLKAALQSQIPGLSDLTLISITNGSVVISYTFSLETNHIAEQYLNSS